jgi:hypothetical protein
MLCKVITYKVANARAPITETCVTSESPSVPTAEVCDATRDSTKYKSWYLKNMFQLIQVLLVRMLAVV